MIMIGFRYSLFLKIIYQRISTGKVLLRCRCCSPPFPLVVAIIRFDANKATILLVMVVVDIYLLSVACRLDAGTGPNTCGEPDRR